MTKRAVCGVVMLLLLQRPNLINKMAADLNQITIPGMLVQLPDFCYSMYKKNDLEETIIQCMYLDWTYVACVIWLAIIGGASPKAILETGIVDLDWSMWE